MPAVARVATDSAGGLITGNLAPTVFVNNKNVAVLGATVASHGTSTHAAATLNQGSATVYANNNKVCRVGDTATCAHAVGAGSANVFSN